MSGPLGIPLFLLADSYKIVHPFLFPDAQKLVGYAECRSSFNKDPEDQRIVFYGLRYIIENYIAIRWSEQDVSIAEEFFRTHNAGYTPFEFPKDLFLKFVREKDGWFPVRIEALPEGSVVYPHVPVFQIVAEGEYSRLITFLETVLLMSWYPTTVGTLSRRARDVIEQAYAETVDADQYWSLESRLHDFGFRACTSVEQSVIGGSAHLLNFTGSDTLSAAYYTQYKLNDGKPVATSIPATEHSIMTSHRTEREAIVHMIERFGQGVFACVMDSYDYAHALESILPSVASHKINKGGYLVLRPDSGDPVQVVLMALRSAEKVFGCTTNKKGYKVINGCGVIQGDAVTYQRLKDILAAVKEAGYSAQNVAFGMGGALLQKVNRDNLSFAFKLSEITLPDGTKRNVMKVPKGDLSKISLPGSLAVVYEGPNERPMVYPRESVASSSNKLRTVYDHGPVANVWDSFDCVRRRVCAEWKRLPPIHDPLSDAMKEKLQLVRQSLAQENEN